ncbi:hypothetical protein FHR83_002175 [Actinoplanes campanulatus]|uniref:Uncharacterized protein n=1 Tax=Actinoplanes campanulatus TaxID=113559 RepID=A0A7W5FDI6_9ACTN|nr:hypothetical protein [Actinoplanes campanulatus]MBB3094523.1 hypothetical protein [Actinoplanes campanulatus]
MKEPRLTQVTLQEDFEDPTGRVVLDEPFAPSIIGVTAPDDWVGVLAGSLAEETGTKVQTGPATLPDGDISFGVLGGEVPGIPQTLFYVGVERVSAEFTVACSTSVTGVFESWSTIDFGGVACGSFDEPQEPLGRLARTHCPATPEPRPSGYVDAVPFNEPSPF